MTLSSPPPHLRSSSAGPSLHGSALGGAPFMRALAICAIGTGCGFLAACLIQLGLWP